MWILECLIWITGLEGSGGRPHFVDGFQGAVTSRIYITSEYQMYDQKFNRGYSLHCFGCSCFLGRYNFSHITKLSMWLSKFRRQSFRGWPTLISDQRSRGFVANQTCSNCWLSGLNSDTSTVVKIWLVLDKAQSGKNWLTFCDWLDILGLVRMYLPHPNPIDLALTLFTP